MPKPTDPALQPLDRLVGTWTTEATHPAMPGVVVKGTAVFEWLEGQRFLTLRSHNEHPEFPDSLSVIGFTDQDRIDRSTAGDPPAEHPLTMHYFDSRGVFRVYEASIDEQALRIRRLAPGFSQKFVGTFTDGGRTLAGQWQLSENDATFDDDLKITYRRT